MLKPFVVAIGLALALSGPALTALPLQVTASSSQISQVGQVVQFELANPGQEAAMTHVFNLQGQVVAELSAQSLSHFSWDGTDTDNQPVDAGFYVVQISHHGEVWHGPIMVNR